MAKHVFISYAREDREVADTICASLEAGQLTVWIDHRDAEIGTSYADSLTDAMTRTAAVVLVLSPSSARSLHVEREIAAAGHGGIPVFVYAEHDVDIPEHLRFYVSGAPLRHADLPREERVAAFTSEVVTAVRSGAGRRHAPSDLGPAPGSVAVTADIAYSLRRAASRVLRRSVVIAIVIYALFLLWDAASLSDDWLPHLESWTATVDDVDLKGPDVDLEESAVGITIVHLMTAVFLGIVTRAWWIGVAAARALEGQAGAEFVHLPIFSLKRPFQPRTLVRHLLVAEPAARGPWSVELWWPAILLSLALGATNLVLILMPSMSPALAVIVLLFASHMLALIGAALLVRVAGISERLVVVPRPMLPAADTVRA